MRVARAAWPRPTLAAALLGFVGLLDLHGLAGDALAAPPLSPDDRAAVFDAAGLRAEGATYRRSGCDTPLAPDTEVLDLDGDGQPEVLLYLGPSRCFADGRGGNVALFVKDRADGRWSDRLGFVPGVEVQVQESRHLGLPDLGVANPGGCMPIYRWNGTAYVAGAQKALQPGGCQYRE